MTDYHRLAKERYWGLPVPGHLKHGRGTYACQIYGCDCSACLPSGRRKRKGEEALTRQERLRRLKAAKKGCPVPPGTKHGVYTYAVYNCRCAVCQCANAANRHAARQRWRQTATAHWSELEDGVTVVHWPPVGQGHWTCPDCGQTFRRRTPTRREDVAA